MPLIFWLIILFVALNFLSVYYQRILQNFWFLRIFLFVGIFIHEFSHYMACKLTGAKVRFFKVGLREGHVTHEKSLIPILGGLIISLAPILCGSALLILLNMWLVGWGWSDISAHSLGTEWGRLLQDFWRSINFTSPKIWLYIFLVYNILATFTPSRQDYKNIFIGIIVWILVSWFTPWLEGVNLILFYALAFALGLLIIATVILRGILFVKK